MLNTRRSVNTPNRIEFAETAVVNFIANVP